jgi:hypothetical protein
LRGLPEEVGGLGVIGLLVLLLGLLVEAFSLRGGLVVTAGGEQEQEGDDAEDCRCQRWVSIEYEWIMTA